MASHQGLCSRLFASFQHWGSARYAPLVHERKNALFRGLCGRVLEIGAGTGVNFDYFPADIQWIGLDPNPHMHRHLRARAESLGRRDVDLRLGIAEQLPLDDASVDAVVATLVLCSVTDLARSLAEIRRVLRPGGTFYFLEHVAAPEGSRLRRVQRIVRRPWRFIGDGCMTDRETLKEIEESGFATVEAETFSVSVPIVSPHIAGTARK